MTLVNDVADEEHLPRLMGSLFEQVRAVFASEDWQGLRMSHFRLLELVPPDGVTITELASRLRMTKQGCGQFVSQLTESGHLRTVPDPADRRSRIVRRTAKGTRLTRRAAARIAAIEADWADRVGQERYADFRSTLAELARS
ncbi:MarR family winged helix-turn-helix transcriptional regulator [Terrabacter sp. AAH1]